MAADRKWPTTVDEAVRVLHRLLPEDEQRKIAEMAEDDLILMHFGLGAWIRNNLGLWQGNTALQAATGESDADGASSAILMALWLSLRPTPPKLH